MLSLRPHAKINRGIISPSLVNIPNIILGPRCFISSVLGYPLGTEQANGFPVNTSSDPDISFSHPKKTKNKACLVKGDV